MLHVTNGDSAAGTLRAAGVEGTILPWRDVLHEGPVPTTPDEAVLRAARARFLATTAPVGAPAIERDLAARDARLAAALAAGEQLLLWFESDLYDMLQLAQVLDRLLAHPGAAALVIVGEDPFAAVPQLGRAQVADLLAGGSADGLARRTPVDGALAAAGAALWAALRASDPAALVALAAGTPALPALGEAAHRLLEQLPWRGAGVNRTERALLAAVRDGAATFEEAFECQQRDEERPFMGDATAFAYLRALAGGPPPLLRLNGRLALTPDARGVLAGEREWLGRPERWIGGMRLPAGRAPWQWDPVAGRVS